MLLKKSFQKTKNFFHKACRTLKPPLSVGYPYLATEFSLSSHQLPSHNVPGDNQSDQYLHKENMEVLVMRPNGDVNDANHGSGRSLKIFDDGIVRNKREARKRLQEGSSGASHAKDRNGAGYGLAKKMKELDMMDTGCVDHLLDVEEALHYYSQLTCPIYLEIVDKFFADMYTEFFLPQPSIGLNNSSRRLDSSSHRLRPLVL